MAYQIYKTNGDLFTTVLDNQIKSDVAPISLVGKNATNYGTALNQDLVRMLENFTNSTSPTNPLKGQLWFDTSTGAGVLNVYNGTGWKSISSVTNSPSNSAPSNPTVGDLWFDTTNQQVNIYSGSAWVLVGPSSTSLSGTNGFKTSSYTTGGSTKYFADVYASGTRVAIFSKEDVSGTGFTGFNNIKAGMNFNTSIAEMASNGIYNVRNLTIGIGSGDPIKLSYSSDNGIISNEVSSGELQFKVKDSGGTASTPLKILGADGSVVPSVTATTNLGSSSLKFNKIYGTDVYGTIRDAAQTYITSVGTLTGLTASGNVVPNANLTVDLGATAARWANIFVGNVTATTVTASGNVTGGNLVTTGNVNAGNANITNTITTANLTVTGNLNVTATGPTTFNGNLLPSANVTYNIGSSTAQWLNVFAQTFTGVSTTAKYADLAERYEADAEYAPGTLLMIGGDKEVTIVNEEISTDVWGVVSTAPAYLMNSDAGTDATHPPVALVGRVPVRVVGAVKKGEALVSAGNGCARVAVGIDKSHSFARSLETNDHVGEKLVLCAIK